MPVPVKVTTSRTGADDRRRRCRNTARFPSHTHVLPQEEARPWESATSAESCSFRFLSCDRDEPYQRTYLYLHCGF